MWSQTGPDVIRALRLSADDCYPDLAVTVVDLEHQTSTVRGDAENVERNWT
jgi:hypothetical protein